MSESSPASVLSMIDHAVLHPTQTDEDLRKDCLLCMDAGVASVCVKPSYVSLTAELLSGSNVVPSTVIGFPHGGTSTATKAAETKTACQHGAMEVDMVVNIGWVLAHKWDAVLSDIRAVVETAKEHSVITKVIFETGLLPNDDLKKKLCELSEQAEADFVKTSTGFGFVKQPDGSLKGTGATEHDIRLMRATCSEKMQVKASGGIRSYEDAIRFVELGATRLGTSGTAAIAAGQQSSGGY